MIKRTAPGVNLNRLKISLRVRIPDNYLSVSKKQNLRAFHDELINTIATFTGRLSRVEVLYHWYLALDTSKHREWSLSGREKVLTEWAPDWEEARKCCGWCRAGVRWSSTGALNWSLSGGQTWSMRQTTRRSLGACHAAALGLRRRGSPRVGQKRECSDWVGAKLGGGAEVPSLVLNWEESTLTEWVGARLGGGAQGPSLVPNWEESALTEWAPNWKEARKSRRWC